jgi:ubiquinone/menaquinone biosynthesis C-methylase UbiE
MEFKDHFSGHAAGYRSARPSYPHALFDWLAAQAPRREIAWDCGCGNGQASVALAAHFVRVFASDPSANQIANAEPRANIDYHVEAAEQCSLPDHSASLVTVAQALHWFEVDAFHAQVRRVLEPRGVIAAWTYSDCHVDAAVDRVKDHLYVDLTGPYWPPERRHVDAGYRTLPFPFTEIASPAFDMHAIWTLAQFLAYLRSWSASQRYLKTTGKDPVTLVENDLHDAWGDAQLPRKVRWSFHLRCGRP